MSKHTVTQRTPETMFELILSVAQNDVRIRGVYLNGSRANPNVEPDLYQDFDVVYVVKETLPFIDDQAWIHRFGELAIVQEPDRMDFELGKAVDFSKRYAWLMLFSDGNRIDLTIISLKEAEMDVVSDPLTVVLLDKDHRFPQLPPPSDAAYHVKPPTQALFSACTNEFWWCLNNVGKGLGRNELPYALGMLNEVVRPMLNRMVDWWIGTHTAFAVNPGKFGKFYRQFLPPELYTQLMQTYSGSEPSQVWEAVFCACELFEQLSREVSKACSLNLEPSEGVNTLRYLRRIASVDGKESIIPANR
jgi:aminoglycoside 6-adenylyltransferase